MKLLVHDDHAALYLDLIQARFPDLEIAVSERYDTLPAVIAELAPEIVLSTKFAGAPYPRAALVETPSVTWVHVCGSGIDHLLPWDPARVTVTNSAGFQAEVMAQYALGVILALAMRFPAYSRDTPTRATPGGGAGRPSRSRRSPARPCWSPVWGPTAARSCAWAPRWA